jgi:hypothetical protein
MRYELDIFLCVDKKRISKYVLTKYITSSEIINDYMFTQSEIINDYIKLELKNKNEITNEIDIDITRLTYNIRDIQAVVKNISSALSLTIDKRYGFNPRDYMHRMHYNYQPLTILADTYKLAEALQMDLTICVIDRFLEDLISRRRYNATSLINAGFDTYYAINRIEQGLNAGTLNDEFMQSWEHAFREEPVFMMLMGARSGDEVSFGW